MTVGIKPIKITKIARADGRYFVSLNGSWERIPAKIAKEVMKGNNILPLITLIKENSQIYYLGVFRFIDGSWTTFQLHNIHPNDDPVIVWEEEEYMEVD